MKIRWSAEAAEDLERIGLYIAARNPAAARRVVKTIYDGVGALRQFPERGRTGHVEGSRELVFSGLPYIAVYRVIGHTIEISRIYHGAQDL
jgi:addiction module RelE/StbE family toxin